MQNKNSKFYDNFGKYLKLPKNPFESIKKSPGATSFIAPRDFLNFGLIINRIDNYYLPPDNEYSYLTSKWMGIAMRKNFPFKTKINKMYLFFKNCYHYLKIYLFIYSVMRVANSGLIHYWREQLIRKTLTSVQSSQRPGMVENEYNILMSDHFSSVYFLLIYGIIISIFFIILEKMIKIFL